MDLQSRLSILIIYVTKVVIAVAIASYLGKRLWRGYFRAWLGTLTPMAKAKEFERFFSEAGIEVRVLRADVYQLELRMAPNRVVVSFRSSQDEVRETHLGDLNEVRLTRVVGSDIIVVVPGTLSPRARELGLKFQIPVISETGLKEVRKLIAARSKNLRNELLEIAFGDEAPTEPHGTKSAR